MEFPVRRMSQGYTHREQEEIESYSMGKMPEAEMEAFEEHLLICEQCQHAVAEFDAYVPAVRSAAAHLRNEPAPGWRNWLPRPAWIGAMASAAALIIAGIGLELRPAGPPLTVRLQSVRGVAGEAKAAPRRPLLLVPDLAGLATQPPFRLEIVNSDGARLWNGELRAGQERVQARSLAAGAYYVRVYAQDGRLLREYGLEVAP